MSYDLEDIAWDISDAIATLNKPDGSSLHAIKKKLKALDAPAKLTAAINKSLRNGVMAGSFTKNGSKYQVGKKTSPKKAAKKPAKRKAEKPAKKKSAKKKAKKPAKRKCKHPHTISCAACELSLCDDCNTTVYGTKAAWGGGGPYIRTRCSDSKYESPENDGNFLSILCDPCERKEERCPTCDTYVFEDPDCEGNH